jgi:hypothetical protein
MPFMKTCVCRPDISHLQFVQTTTLESASANGRGCAASPAVSAEPLIEVPKFVPPYILRTPGVPILALDNNTADFRPTLRCRPISHPEFLFLLI